MKRVEIALGEVLGVGGRVALAPDEGVDGIPVCVAKRGQGVAAAVESPPAALTTRVQLVVSNRAIRAPRYG